MSNEDDAQDDIDIENNNDPYDPYIETPIELSRDVYTSKSINLLRKRKEFSELKEFLIDGKDIILSNFSNIGESELYTMRDDYINILISIQTSKFNNSKRGIVPAIDFMYKQNLRMALMTRSKGPQRDRILITPDYKRTANKSKFGGFMGWGKKKQRENENYDTEEVV